MPTKEGGVQAKILVYLLGRPDVFIWRQNTGAARLGRRNKVGAVKTRMVTFGTKGCADIIGIFGPAGRFLAIEVKAPGESQTDEQVEFQRKVAARGGLYVLARSVEDVAFALR